MTQMMVPVSQIEEIARRVFGEQVERLRQELLQEMAARAPRRSEAEERVWEAIRELAQAQARTEERLTRLEAAVEKLAEAQTRTEKRVEELAQAQARAEERLTRLEAAVEKLAEAQARTEEELREFRIQAEERFARIEAALERLTLAQEQMARQLGALSNLLGTDIEVDAEEVLGYVMRQKGYRQIGPAYPLDIDGEIDVAVLLESQTGERAWALVEVKTRMRKHEVEKWSQRLQDPEFLRRLRAVRIEKPYLPYVFGLRVYPDARATAEELGIGVLDPRGELVAAVVLS